VYGQVDADGAQLLLALRPVILAQTETDPICQNLIEPTQKVALPVWEQFFERRLVDPGKL
jgi:hypothetical protein